MGNLRRVSSALVMVVAAAACGDDGASNPDALVIIDAPNPDAPNPDAPPPIDAPDYDFSCYQNQAPTNIAATVTLSGTTTEAGFSGLSPLAGVDLDFCIGNCQGNNLVDEQGPTGATGAFTSDAIPTNGQALDGYVIATKAAYRTTHIYPASPIAQNTAGVPVVLLSNAAIGLIGMIGDPQEAGQSMVVMLVTDCALNPINGASISVKQGTAEVGDPPLDLGSLAAEAAGAWLITNVPPGVTEVSATYNGMTFRAHSMNAVADATAMTQVKPGF